MRILSIDGGGLRGIIPLKILKEIELQTGKPVSESFDLIAGTSTGGILACALTLKQPNGNPLYSLEELEHIYRRDGKIIFPPKTRSKYFHPRFSPTGLKRTLEKYFPHHRLLDCKKPVLIGSYDVRSYKPFLFTSRFVNPGSLDYNSSKNFLLEKICLATSAAPTYLPTFNFSYLDDQQFNVKHNFIDGGVFINNPSLAAVTEVLANNTDALYNKRIDRAENPLKIEDIFLLSLGTGITSKEITEYQGGKGQLFWARPIIDVMMQGNSQSVHHQTQVLLKDRYLRVNALIADEISDMADSSEQTTNGLVAAVNSQVLNDEAKLQEIANFVYKAGL
jgi:patatin-like phospholipase/acyl hydrolase